MEERIRILSHSESLVDRQAAFADPRLSLPLSASPACLPACRAELRGSPLNQTRTHDVSHAGAFTTIYRTDISNVAMRKCQGGRQEMYTHCSRCGLAMMSTPCGPLLGVSEICQQDCGPAMVSAYSSASSTVVLGVELKRTRRPCSRSAGVSPADHSWIHHRQSTRQYLAMLLREC